MGKKSRRQLGRKRQELESPVGSDGLTVTVGVTPQAKANGVPSLANELRLLRSSLMYADQVSLVAPSAAWIGEFQPLRGVDVDDPWSTVTALPAETLRRLGVEDVTPREFRRAMRKLGARPVDDPGRMENERQWNDAIPKLKRQAEEVLGSAESVELDMALEAGSVTMVSNGTRFEDPLERQIGWFRDRLSEALADPGSHLLLDDVTTEFIRGSEKFAGEFSDVARARSRRVTVGTALVERLPTFPDAPMEQVLEARDELSEGRARYRRSVKSLADSLKSSALDATLASEIEELWHDEVRPSLQGLRDTASKTRVAVETSKRLVTEGYGLPTLVVTIANIPDLAVMLPSAAAVAAAAGRVVAAGAGEAFKSRSAVRNHDLVYLLEVDRVLGRAIR